MVELNDTTRMGLLIGAAAIVIFILVNMTGLLGGGDEKLFIIDLIGLGSNSAMRPDTGFSTQDIVGFVIAVAMGALYFISAEDDLDWEALLGDDDDEEE
jgi:Flp pilus assembly protein protease CpaA